MLSRTFITGILLTAGLLAQDLGHTFPKPSYFREVFQKTRTQVELKDPVKLRDYVINDRLELSLKDYLALVMANNTNVQIQLLTIESPKNAIQRAMSVWDPTASASFSSRRSVTPPTSVLEGASSDKSVQLSQPFSATVTQRLDTGTQLNFGYAASKTSSNNSFNNYNPALNSSLSFDFTQPLIRDRGRFVNRINLMVARSNYRIADFNLRQSLLGTINSAENVYWDLILARESLKVAQGALNRSNEYLKYVERQLELGAISPLDIYGPQQDAARSALAVSQATYTLAQREDALRQQIGADLDPDIRKLPIDLTEPVELPATAALDVDKEQAVATGLGNRPDLKSSAQRLDVDDLQIQSAKNGLLPSLALTGSYQTQGRGGPFYQRQNVFSEAGSSTIITTVPGGFSDALSQMFGFGFNVYSLGLRLNLPIRSRAAAADLADAMVRKKSDSLSLRNSQQSVRLSVLNAVTNLNGAKEQLKLARTQADFAQKNLDAENRKYELGTTIYQNVIRAQQDKTDAENNVVGALVGLRRSLLSLWNQTGELLDQRGIVVPVQ